MPRTLEPFAWLLKQDKHEIHCPQMFLDPRSSDAHPLFEGSGSMTLNDHGEFEYYINARVVPDHPFEQAIDGSLLKRLGEESMFRLRAVDYSGTEWNGGWVLPTFGEVLRGSWQLHGKFQSLLTGARHDDATSSVELAFSPTPNVPFTEQIKTTAHLGDTELGWRTSGGRHRMEILGSEIEVFTQPWSNELWIHASTSSDLTHPYLENWLSEPLRALRGQLIYPRLAARKFADGSAKVWVMSSHALKPTLGGCASQLRNRSAAEFWSFYERYLTYVAEHRGADGHPNFEANTLTRLHNEVIQARLAGSDWVIALCLGSAIEGIAKLDAAFKNTPAEFTDEQIKPLSDLIPRLEPEGLRKRMSGTVSRFGEPSTSTYLSRLSKAGQITKAQLFAWQKIRHKVAHGNLFEPWGTQAEGNHLIQLLGLFYRLTALRIGYVGVAGAT